MKKRGKTGRIGAWGHGQQWMWWKAIFRWEETRPDKHAPSDHFQLGRRGWGDAAENFYVPGKKGLSPKYFFSFPHFYLFISLFPSPSFSFSFSSSSFSSSSFPTAAAAPPPPPPPPLSLFFFSRMGYGVAGKNIFKKERWGDPIDTSTSSEYHLQTFIFRSDCIRVPLHLPSTKRFFLLSSFIFFPFFFLGLNPPPPPISYPS